MLKIVSFFVIFCMFAGCAGTVANSQRDAATCEVADGIYLCNGGDQLMKYEEEMKTGMWIETIYRPMQERSPETVITSICLNGFHPDSLVMCQVKNVVSVVTCYEDGLTVKHDFVRGWNHPDSTYATNACKNLLVMRYN